MSIVLHFQNLLRILVEHIELKFFMENQGLLHHTEPL